MPAPKYTHWKNSPSKYAACGTPNPRTGTCEKLQVTCPRCLRIVERSDRLNALPQQCYESVIKKTESWLAKLGRFTRA
ncbi:hypothetical protein [Nostoc punctiforme]|uniref:Uncharacterized protein n=1 Tax=Nostoc punctiforme NIES-2108 TaxID=1356359 RepID=A0A367RXB6_NOSPU|nr:hypothetical protein [Nostoc punctiforme]RCJ41165.1 hypothetical protein A6769_38685 [Nostoc punctiforme NIES-2108]